MRRGNVGFILLTVCLVFVAAFCVTGTVISEHDPGAKEVEAYYRQLEQELVQEIREYLAVAGFENSGVTLTRVLDGDGVREYTITIHHGTIDRMDEAAREKLTEQLSELVFVADNCTFCHEFLVAD